LVRQHHVTLVVHGPYRWICHPFYTFSFLMVAAVALMTGLVVWVGAAGLAFAATIF
jgi:protein-S-isoprenylcysteine O-methyltransferase Ste14